MPRKFDPEDGCQIISEDLKDYIYAIETRDVDLEENDFYVVCFERYIWKEEGCWDDSGIYPDLLNDNGFYCLMESLFEVDPRVTVQDVHDKMKKLGIEHKPELVS